MFSKLAEHLIGRNVVWILQSATGEKPMSILGWLILGLIAGFIGSKIVNSQGQGFFLNIALGIVGAIIGGIIFTMLAYPVGKCCA